MGGAEHWSQRAQELQRATAPFTLSKAMSVEVKKHRCEHGRERPCALQGDPFHHSPDSQLCATVFSQEEGLSGVERIQQVGGKLFSVESTP